jgi:hypothetical protein
VGIYGGGVVLVRSRNGVATLPLPKNIDVIDDRAVELIFSEQAHAAAALRTLLRSHWRGGSNGIAYVGGDAGVGKTFLLDSSEADLSLETDYLRINMTGLSGHDSRKICELILFMHFGPAAFELDALDPSVLYASHQARFLGHPLLARLARAAGDALEAQALVRDLSSNRGQRSVDLPIVDPLPAATPVVVVIDDLHRLSGAEADLIGRVLQEQFAGNHNSFILLSGRAGEFESPELARIVRLTSIHRVQISPPSATEVAQSAEQIIGRTVPRAFAGVLSEVRYSTLMVVNLLAHLRDGHVHDGNEPALMEVLTSWRDAARAGHDKTILEAIARSPALYPLLDIVHSVQGGIPIVALQRQFADRLLNEAAARKLLRLDENNLVCPFHDLVADAYVSVRGGCYTTAVGEFLVASLDVELVEPEKALPTLVKCGPTFRASYLSAVVGQRDSFLKQGRFGPALEPARSIVEVLQAAGSDDLSEAHFILGDCLNHCSPGDESRAHFERARGVLAEAWLDPINASVRLEAQSELFNLDFWALNVDSLGSLRAFVDRVTKLVEGRFDVQSDHRLVRCYLTALNRLMVFELLLDHDHKPILQRNVAATEGLMAENYRGFALVDCAKGTYHLNVAAASRMLLQGRQIFERLGSEYRRLLTSTAEVRFLACRTESGTINELRGAATDLAEADLWPEYLNAALKIVGVALVNGDTDLAGAQMEEYHRRQTASADSRRRKFLVANLEAALAYLRADFRACAEWNEEHRVLVGQLGGSYRAVAEANHLLLSRSPRRPARVAWFRQGARKVARFLIDPRIW